MTSKTRNFTYLNSKMQIFVWLMITNFGFYVETVYVTFKSEAHGWKI